MRAVRTRVPRWALCASILMVALLVGADDGLDQLMPHDVLAVITRKILATEKIDYIFYDITNKPPGTIEWE